MNRITYKFLIILIASSLLSSCMLDFGKFFCQSNKSSKTTKSSKPIAASKNFPIEQKISPTMEAENYYLEASTSEEQSIALRMFEHLAKLNDMHATIRVAEMYLNGIGTEQNPTIAMQWFRKAAINGSPVAMWRMGNMYRDGIGEPYNLNKAIEWYQKAATVGNIKAMLSLGEIYRGWYGMHPDYNKSMSWYVRAAGMGSLEAEYQIIRLVTNDLIDQNKYSEKITSVLASLKKAAKEGDVDAMVAVGDHYMHHLDNISLALEYYEQAASKNFSPALLRLGLLYLHGQSVTQNYLVAIDFFTKAANMGNMIAEYHLGEIYRKGLGVPKNVQLASDWYGKAVKNNFPKALARLADLYFSGKGITPDLYKAIDLYITAAKAGDTYSGLLLSIFYAEGLGVTQNLPLSVHWYNVVEQKQDQLLAKFDVAKNYETGFGFKKNYSKAAKWYLLAANEGLAKAQTKLAELYADGLGVTQDYQQAISWYQKAADQGYSYAQYSLGLLLQSDVHKKSKNPKVAYNFMKKAAINGYTPAQYSLALMLLQGTGTPVNAVKAYGWLHIALNDGGYESNPELMNILINKLEPEARNRAVLLVQRYRDRYNLSVNQEF